MDKIRQYFFTVFLIFFQIAIVCSPVSAQVDFVGYYKNEIAVISKKSGEILIADINKLRFRIETEINQDFKIQLEPEYVSLFNSESLNIAGISETEKLVWDRVYARLSVLGADYTIGRQRIAWGVGSVWQPTDVFNIFAYSFVVAEEERRGVEAVRIQIPFGIATELEGVVLTAGEFAQSAKGIRYRTNVENYDLSLSFVDMANNEKQIGFDLIGELWELGVYTEWAFRSNDSGGSYSQGVLGINYTFENGWGVDTEFFFNSQGVRSKDAYDWSAYKAGKIMHLAKNYGYFGLRKILDEITYIGMALIINGDDNSLILSPSYTRNVFENFDLSIQAVFMGGEDASQYNPGTENDSSGYLGASLFFLKGRYSF
ncbi:hypothetical protein ACFLZV_01560 [Candidatus Margulisiibacteriota bacterium]